MEPVQGDEVPHLLAPDLAPWDRPGTTWHSAVRQGDGSGTVGSGTVGSEDRPGGNRGRAPGEPPAPDDGSPRHDGSPRYHGEPGTGPESGTGEAPEDAPEPPPTRRPPPVAGPGLRWTLAALTLLLVLWAATTVVPTTSRIAIDLALFAPLQTVVAVPVIAAAAHWRRWIAVTLGLAAAVTPWVLVAGYAAPDATKAPAGSVTLRVLAVDADRGAVDPAALTTTVQQHAIDVLVISDLTDDLAHRLTVAGLSRLLVPRWVSLGAGATSGVGVWSREDLDAPRALDGFPLGAGTGALHTPDGPVLLVVAHVTAPFPPSWPPTGDAGGWARQLRLLGEAASPGGAEEQRLHLSGRTPRLVVGSLNATPWNPQFRALAHQGLTDAADATGHGLRPTWPSWSALALTPLDHVLVGRRTPVSATDTLSMPGTDHRALLVTLSVPPG